RGAVVLLGLGRRGGGAAAADRFPGPVVELVFAAVAAVGGDDRRVAAGLAGGDRFERLDRDAAGQRRERFTALAARFGADPLPRHPDRVVEVGQRRRDLRDADRLRVGDADRGRLGSVGEGGRRKGDRGGEGRNEICAFREQARD